MLPKAYVHLPCQVHYRREAFIQGFRRLGFEVHEEQPDVVAENEVAVIWNKTPRSGKTMDAGRKGGGAIIVAENGYFGADVDGHQPYALALDGHCGSGRWYAPDGSRLKALHVPFEPFRWLDDCKGILIAEQRGIGSKDMRSPPEWGDKMAKMLEVDGFEVIRRAHPGVDKNSGIPIDTQFAQVNRVVVWSSNCATKALIKGIHTYYDAPHIVTKGGAQPFRRGFPSVPFTDESRNTAFERMAWAQFFVDEIASGYALDLFLKVHRGELPSCNKGFPL